MIGLGTAQRRSAITDRDKALIEQARTAYWADIDETAAETLAGRCELHRIAMKKYHAEEAMAGME